VYSATCLFEVQRDFDLWNVFGDVSFERGQIDWLSYLSRHFGDLDSKGKSFVGSTGDIVLGCRATVFQWILTSAYGARIRVRVQEPKIYELAHSGPISPQH
jgi:hypothetical protein